MCVYISHTFLTLNNRFQTKMGGWGSQLQGGLPSLLTSYGVTWYARFRAARVVPSCVDFWRGGRHPRRPHGPSGPCGHAVDPMTRRSLVSCSPTSRATALPDIAETKALTRASNSKVKPPPSRAHGTLIFLTPHLSQRARGTRACSPLLVTVHGGASRSRLVSRMSVSPRFARPDRAWRRARRRQGRCLRRFAVAWGPFFTASASR